MGSKGRAAGYGATSSMPSNVAVHPLTFQKLASVPTRLMVVLPAPELTVMPP